MVDPMAMPAIAGVDSLCGADCGACPDKAVAFSRVGDIMETICWAAA